MCYELPNRFKYGMYSNGCYLAQELFQLDGVNLGLFEVYGVLSIKAFGFKPLRLETIQDLNDFKCYILNNGGKVDWNDFQDVLVSLNSYTKDYSIYQGESHLTTVQEFLQGK